MKRAMICWLALALFFCGGCAMGDNQTLYERAQRYLGAGDYDTAAYLFDQLGEWGDSASYALYARGLLALSHGEDDLARANFTAVSPFKSSKRYLTYLDARARQSDDPAGALALFEQLGSFLDSAAQAANLRAELPVRQLAQCRALLKAGQYSAAQALLASMRLTDEVRDLQLQCVEGMQKLQYAHACSLYDAGRYEEALDAFGQLGNVMDAPARQLLCRSAMYRAAVATSPTLENVPQLMETFLTLENYLDSADRLRTLHEQFDVNLCLAQMADARPFVSLGVYPTMESGEEDDLLWRVQRVEDGRAYLLCQQVIDASPASSATDLPIHWNGSDSAITLCLPTEDEAASLLEHDRRAPATSYAIAQGVRHAEDGCAWWWLSGEGERHPIVWYNGRILESGVAAQERCVGVRPMAVVPLRQVFFTCGSGTAEDPFRIEKQSESD